MEFRVLVTFSFAFGLAGVVVGSQVAIIDFWVPGVLGVIAFVLAVGSAFSDEFSDKQAAVGVVAMLVAAVAVAAAAAGWSELEDLRNQSETPADTQRPF